MSVHLFAFVDFVNIFIRYKSRHHTSELSINFINVCSSLQSAYLINSIQVSFHVEFNQFG